MRILEEKGVNSTDGALDGKVYRELAGNSGEVDGLDTSDLAGGSKLELTDTGEKKIFDEDSGAWNTVASGGGGGGGGSSVLVVEMDETAKLNKTWQEIKDAPFAVVDISLSTNTRQVGLILDVTAGVNVYVVTIASYVESTGQMGFIKFTTDSPDGYPQFVSE